MRKKRSKYYQNQKTTIDFQEHSIDYNRCCYGVVIGTLLIPIISTAYINLTTSSDRYSSSAQVPKEDVAIVFGAGLSADGTPSPMLADRVESAVKLYQNDRIHKLLMTGDNSAISYNEVIAMKRYAHNLGVPTKDITLDYAGFSTYESCYRAHKIFDVHQAVVLPKTIIYLVLSTLVVS